MQLILLSACTKDSGTLRRKNKLVVSFKCYDSEQQKIQVTESRWPSVAYSIQVVTQKPSSSPYDPPASRKEAAGAPAAEKRRRCRHEEGKVHRRSLNLSSSYKIVPQPQNQISEVPQLTKPFA